jgi:hypothetical protein
MPEVFPERDEGWGLMGNPRTEEKGLEAFKSNIKVGEEF